MHQQHCMYLVLLALLGATPAPGAAPRVDALGRTVEIPSRPVRIAALAPHLVEMLFAVGAGDRIVATVAHADHPAQAAELERVGDAFALSLERLAAARPQLILAWRSALGAGGLAQLERLGVPVWVSEPENLEAVRDEFAAITAMVDGDRAPVEAFAARLRSLQPPVGARRVPVLPLVSIHPPLTVADDQFIGDVLRRCGAFNPEGDHGVGPVLELSREQLPSTTAELVLITTPAGETEGLGLPPGTEVVRLDPDLMVRPGPRVLEGVARLCERIEARR
jgi:ABC-type Fe3+-hydroxamate transport system substrate-binding protein